MISLSVSNLTLNFGVDTILEGISFAAEEGDKLGIVGVNGSGKSTLFRLIKGEYSPDEGSVFIAKDKTIGMLEQDDTFKTTTEIEGAEVGSTVLEQMYAAFPDLYRMEARLAELQIELERRTDHENQEYMRLANEFTQMNQKFISDGGLHYKSRCVSFLNRLGFPEQYHGMSVTKLSGGQRTRLALARLLSSEPDILMLDEPTNHLDTDTMMWLEGHLAAYKKTVLLVSHDRYFLDRVTNKILEIEHLHAKLYNGNYSRYIEQKEADRTTYEKHYKLQQREIARIEAYIAQQRAWGRERNIIAAESREKALARMDKLEKPKAAPKSIRFEFTGSGESGNEVLNVRDLRMGFGNRMLFSNMNYLIKKRERVFIAGANGCGKSTLIKILLGQIEPLDGLIEFGYNVTIGYYDQENQNLDSDKTVLDELWDAYGSMTQTEVRNVLALFLFRGDDIEKKVAVLSGGERARLTLAKLILSKMNLLILDEPTNHLDINSREALETALSDFDGTIIAVSHDRYFASKLATRVIEIGDEGKIRDFRGSYEEYLTSKLSTAGEFDSSEADTAELSSKDQYLSQKQEAAEIRKKQKQKEATKKEIKSLEHELVEIQDELFGDAASDYQRAAELEDRRIIIEDRLMQLYELEEIQNQEEF